MALEKADRSQISRYVRDTVDRLPPRAMKAVGIGRVTGTPQADTPPATDVSDRLATTAFVRSILPAGVVIPFAGATAPTGWLIADGSAVSRSKYLDLFNAIGTTFGAGDGLTTFNLPNMSGRVALGSGTATGANGATNHVFGSTGGEETHVLTQAELASHTHTFTGAAMGTHTHTFTGTAMAGHAHTFTGTAMAGHAHNSFATNPGIRWGAAYTTTGSSKAIGDVDGLTGSTDTNTGNPTTNSVSAGTPAGSINSVSAGTPAGTNAAVSAGTPAGTNSTTGSDTAHNNLPPFVTLTHIIKF